jgi:hypothetical protein
MKKSIAASLLLSLAIWSLAQNPTSESWGNAVDGIQFRLAVPTRSFSAQPKAVQIPELHVQLRNQGNRAVTYQREALYVWVEIEIHGVWYRDGSMTCCTVPQTLAPGNQTAVLPVRFEDRNLFQLDSNGAPTTSLRLTPGKHSLRVRTFSGDRRISLQTSPPRGIVVISNPATVEIPFKGVMLLPELSSALDQAKACIAKSPGTFRTVWRSPLDFDVVQFGQTNKKDHMHVFISERTPQGWPRGVGIDVNTRTGECVVLTGLE